MVSLLESLAAVAAAFTALSTVLLFVAKHLIDKGFAAGLERYKLSLQQDLEAHKMTLQLNNFKFTKLHEAQCLAIKELYLILNNYRSCFEEADSLVRHIDKPKYDAFQRILSNLGDKGVEVELCYKQNQIVLSTAISNLINDTIQDIFRASNPLLHALIASGIDRYDDDSGNHLGIEYLPLTEVSNNDKIEFDSYIAKLDQAKEKTDNSLKLLANEFRKIYGSYQA